MAIKDTVLGWLRSTPEEDQEPEETDIDLRPARKSTDKEDVMAAPRWGMRLGSEFEDDQEKPRH
jgi:hypothetical protein